MGFVEHYCSSVVQDAEAGRSVISVSDPRFGSKHRAFGGLRCKGAPAIYYFARRVDFDCQNGCHGQPASEQAALNCQSAFKFDPVSASNFDPFERRVLTVALASSELAGVAETWRARAA
jgi:hypothetical protein